MMELFFWASWLLIFIWFSLFGLIYFWWVWEVVNCNWCLCSSCLLCVVVWCFGCLRVLWLIVTGICLLYCLLWFGVLCLFVLWVYGLVVFTGISYVKVCLLDDLFGWRVL